MSDELSVGVPTPTEAELLAGISVLSGDQSLTFTKYVKTVLPLDGYVFWLRGESVQIAGSLHYATTVEINEDETLGVNSVTFTTSQEIEGLDVTNGQLLWVANYRDIQFAFSAHGRYYEQARLYHYTGQAVYPALASQLVDDLYGLAASGVIVSDSLPVWLALQTYQPIWFKSSNPCLPLGQASSLVLYPSFLVPQNIQPPYGVVHIEPSQTHAIQAFPFLSSTDSHVQLAADHVRITLYGCANNVAQDLVELINQYSLDTEVIGIMNMPILRDEKRTQSEIAAIAMKKTIEYDVSYYQTRVRNIARQLILDVIVQYTVEPYPT